MFITTTKLTGSLTRQEIPKTHEEANKFNLRYKKVFGCRCSPFKSSEMLFAIQIYIKTCSYLKYDSIFNNGYVCFNLAIGFVKVDTKDLNVRRYAFIVFFN